MRMNLRTVALTLAVSLALAGAAQAQVWRGMGRLAGKVVDESGSPIEGVTVKAMLASADNAGPASTSNRKGEWAIGGIAGGRWEIAFSKDGYEPRSLPVQVSEYARLPPRDIVLKKVVVVVDPNEVIKEKLIEAAALMNAGKFAEARAMYQGLASEYPDVPQFEPLLARAYYGEGNKEKAIEHLRSAAAREPDNIEVRLLLGNFLMEAGKTDEGRQILESVDASKVADPTVYLNVGIGMINEGKHEQAVNWFDKAITRFPDQAEAYYYRGISKLSLEKTDEAKADLEKFVSIAKPDAPELPLARKILESLK